MSQVSSEEPIQGESPLGSNSISLETKRSSSPAFTLNLFNRKVIEPSSPDQHKKVTITCNAPGCRKIYKQPYPGNTSTLLQHFKSKHKHELVKMAQEAIESGKRKQDTILGTKLLVGLPNLPCEITDYLQVDKTKSKPDSGNSVTSSENSSEGKKSTPTENSSAEGKKTIPTENNSSKRKKTIPTENNSSKRNKSTPTETFSSEENTSIPAANSSSQENKSLPHYANCSPEYFGKIFTQYLVGHNIPFTVCDDFLTKRMLDGARLGLSRVVSRSQITLQLKKLYFRQVRKLKKEFAHHDGRFALTVNEWKSKNNNSFLGISLHFLDESFELKRYHIGLEHIAKTGAHAKSLAKTLNKVLQYYNINGRIVSITSDKSSDMSKAVTIFKKPYQGKGKGVDENVHDVSCFAHVCNLSVMALMGHAFPQKAKTGGRNYSTEEAPKNPTDDDIYEIYAGFPASTTSFPEKVRDFITAVNQNDVVGSLFEKAVAKREHTDSSRKKNLNTQNGSTWVSEYEMIKSFLYFKDQIIEVYTEFAKSCPAHTNQTGVFEIYDSEWEYLQLLRDILEVFVGPTNALQGSTYVTVHATIPTVHSLLKKLKEINTETFRVSYPNTSIGLSAAYDTLYKHYPIYEKDCGSMKILYLATVLHPKYKLQYFHTRESFPKELINCIRKHLQGFYNTYQNTYTGNAPQNEGKLETHSQNHPSPKIEGVEEVDFSYLSDDDDDVVVEEEHDEVTAYLSEKLKNKNIVPYYQSEKHRYPILSQLAKDIMAIPASSPPTESFVSGIGNMVAKTRNRLNPATTKMLAVVKDSVSKISPFDVESGVESGDEIDDDADLSAQFNREINDNEAMEVDMDEGIGNN